MEIYHCGVFTPLQNTNKQKNKKNHSKFKLEITIRPCVFRQYAQ